MTIREIREEDFDSLMRLYTHLHETDVPALHGETVAVWEKILRDKNYHIIVAEIDGKLVSSCTCVVIPNLTRKRRPYTLVENVVTDEAYRGQGLATACLDYAKELAKRENCYKIMLLTGSKAQSTLAFYERAGYNCKDKTAFIQWL
ncbi:MAG: GNAT family N-acetyltransferase [Clostridia bacterium]|nr:GNAT family N-acetyltransferase [Clostridia bacterium]